MRRIKNLLDRLFVWKRISILERDFEEKKRNLEGLLEPPEDDWGITREIRQLKEIINLKRGEN